MEIEAKRERGNFRERDWERLDFAEEEEERDLSDLGCLVFVTAARACAKNTFRSI